jgi:hypothetical protein
VHRIRLLLDEGADCCVTLRHPRATVEQARRAEERVDGDALHRDAEGAELATRAAFARWYDSDWRRESYYLSACGQYLDQLDETHAIEGRDRLPADFFDTLCLLPDGTNYGCHLTDAIAQTGRRGG